MAGVGRFLSRHAGAGRRPSVPCQYRRERDGAARRPLLLPILAAAALAAAGCGADAHPHGDALREPSWAHAPVPAEHARGARLFDAHCSGCHGPAASGSDQGPPLVHATYLPRHHADVAFRLAVTGGVRAHHWRFGDMPSVPGLNDDEIAAITAYIRWLQRVAGLI